MTQTKSRHSRVRLIIIGLLAIVLLIAGGVAARAWQAASKVLAGGGIDEPFDGRYNIALLGSDAAEWRDGARVDSTTIASVDATTGRTLLIAVPRNLTLIPFPESSPLHELYPDGYVCPDQASAPCMMTMVYQLGLDHADLYPNSADPGAQAMVEALEGVSGLRLNYYALINLDGFEDLINALGGIDLTLRSRVPIGAMGQTMYWLEPGEHHFSGEEALWYVRSRVETDDYTRMTRQKCVMLAMLDQLQPGLIATNFLSLAEAAGQVAHTNVPVGQVTTLADLAGQAVTWTVTGLNLTPPLVDPADPDYDQIHQLVAQAVAAAGGQVTNGNASGGSGGVSGTTGGQFGGEFGGGTGDQTGSGAITGSSGSTGTPTTTDLDTACGL